MHDKETFWDTLRQHLSETEQLLDRHFQKPDSVIASILHERAQALYSEENNEQPEQRTLSLVLFNLANEQYAVESRYVNRVCVADKITSLPSVPDSVEGVINLHGNILAVFNICGLLNLPKISAAKASAILVVDHDGMRVGIAVDAMIGTQSIPWNSVQTTLPMTSDIHASYFKGMTKSQLMILDIPKLLQKLETL